MNALYTSDPVTNVRMRAGGSAFLYNDGDEVELRLLSAVEAVTDISAASSELANFIVDWPSEYHFSSTRHNLLRPFNIGPEHTVLELGCGCGAMTRYLGETGATVIAVDGSQRRAQIAAARCRDLANVTIYCDNIIDFVSDSRFDFVMLIGVLEYAPKFIRADDPVGTCLRRVREFLKDDGALVLAIENQFGLKYLNGCDEDHVGVPYYGINGLYGKGDPLTLGRQVLVESLIQAGFDGQEFFYPFPDYKIPGVILSDAGVKDRTLNIADLLIHNTGRNYPETHHRAFAEDLAWRVVTENRLLPDLANSFLVFARNRDANPCPATWLAKMYSRGKRKFCYQIESTIAQRDDVRLFVRKHKLFPHSCADDEWLRHLPMDSTYIPGCLLIGKIHAAIARETGIDELASNFKPWLDFLLAHATKSKTGKQMLPGSFVDCMPANLIERPDGQLQYFDAEWICRESIPLAWPLIRGITYSIAGCLDSRTLKGMTYRRFIVAVAEYAGVSLSEADFFDADDRESRMVAQCHLDGSTTLRLADLLDEPLFLHLRLSGAPELRHRLAWHEAELTRVKQTFSWRLTAPLRVAWNLYQRFLRK